MRGFAERFPGNEQWATGDLRFSALATVIWRELLALPSRRNSHFAI